MEFVGCVEVVGCTESVDWLEYSKLQHRKYWIGRRECLENQGRSSIKSMFFLFLRGRA